LSSKSTTNRSPSGSFNSTGRGSEQSSPPHEKLRSVLAVTMIAFSNSTTVTSVLSSLQVLTWNRSVSPSFTTAYDCTSTSRVPLQALEMPTRTAPATTNERTCATPITKRPPIACHSPYSPKLAPRWRSSAPDNADRKPAPNERSTPGQPPPRSQALRRLRAPHTLGWPAKAPRTNSTHHAPGKHPPGHGRQVARQGSRSTARRRRPPNIESPVTQRSATTGRPASAPSATPDSPAPTGRLATLATTTGLSSTRRGSRTRSARPSASR
jgi:hypothetical protein